MALKIVVNSYTCLSSYTTTYFLVAKSKLLRQILAVIWSTHSLHTGNGPTRMFETTHRVQKIY